MFILGKNVNFHHFGQKCQSVTLCKICERICFWFLVYFEFIITILLDSKMGETGAGCNTFCLIDHITFITQERQSKLISSERVICQLDFHLALKFHTCRFRAVNVLKQDVKCCNMPHITGYLQHYQGTIATQCPSIYMYIGNNGDNTFA